MALDHPERVRRLTLLDIVSTWAPSPGAIRRRSWTHFLAEDRPEETAATLLGFLAGA
jgi:pimeloyl-ACP methyl ester carboxylesterase